MVFGFARNKRKEREIMELFQVANVEICMHKHFTKKKKQLHLCRKATTLEEGVSLRMLYIKDNQEIIRSASAG